MRYLVTGGAGFIGSNLCEDLLNRGNEVVCLDNFSTGYFHNIKDFINNKNFKLIVGDIRNLSDCQKAVDGIDMVFHEAALGSVPRSINDPITTNQVNIDGFLNMLVAVREAKVKRIIYAASSSTYGDSENLPKVEDIIGKPLSPYAVTKYVNELYAHVFALNYGIETIGLRYFNVFGRRQDPNGTYAAVIPKFIIQLMKHESPVIYGDGTTSRDFTYIDNVLQINNLAANTTNQSAVNQVYNVAVGEKNDLNMLTKYLKQFLGKFDSKIIEIEIKYESNRKGDIPHSLASINKADKFLGYKPKFNFEKGIILTIDWYYKRIQNFL